MQNEAIAKEGTIFTCNLLEQLKLSDDAKSLQENLLGNEMFRGDLEDAVGSLKPYIPFVDLLIGGGMILSHVYGRSVWDKVNGLTKREGPKEEKVETGLPEQEKKGKEEK